MIPIGIAFLGYRYIHRTCAPKNMESSSLRAKRPIIIYSTGVWYEHHVVFAAPILHSFHLFPFATTHGLKIPNMDILALSSGQSRLLIYLNANLWINKIGESGADAFH